MAEPVIQTLLRSMIEGVEKSSDKTPDCVVCGSDSIADQVREILPKLNRDMHVIADDELSATQIWVTSLDTLGEFPGGGRN